MSVTEELPSDEHQAPLPMPRRRWRLTVLLGLVIFVSGGVCGIGLGMWLEKQHFLEILRYPERGPERIAARIQSKLQLDDQQTRQVQAIVKKRVSALEEVHRQVDPLLAEQLNLFEADVAEVLNPQQRAEWHRYMKPIPQRWYPLVPARPSSPKVPP
jgi:hypothetical protein